MYKEYLQSEHWKSLKERFYKSKRFKNKCFVCNQVSEKYNIHHKTYKWRGKEKLQNLVALCSKCHTEVHFKDGVKLLNDKHTLNQRVYYLKSQKKII
jgi:5-methylcytosine-specific restriction endonuclease McrA